MNDKIIDIYRYIYLYENLYNVTLLIESSIDNKVDL